MALGPTAAAGVATTAARSDHRHAFPTATDVGAAPASHTHSIATITGLQPALDGKAPASHGHALTDVTGLTAALAAKQDTSAKGAPNGYASLGADGKVPAVADHRDRRRRRQRQPRQRHRRWTGGGLEPSRGQVQAGSQLPITRDRDPVTERTSATALTFNDYHRHIIVLAGSAPLTLAASEVGTAPFQGFTCLIENDHSAQNTITFGAGITVKQPSTGTGTAGQVKIPVDGQLWWWSTRRAAA